MDYFPFRCTGCGKTNYTSSFTKTPECCEGKEQQRLVRICLLIPASPSQTPVLTSRRKPGLVDHEIRWSIACGMKKLPPHYTTEIEACTCKKCRDYAQELLSEVAWEPEPQPDDGHLDYIKVEFEEPPPNPFQKDPDNTGESR